MSAPGKPQEKMTIKVPLKSLRLPGGIMSQTSSEEDSEGVTPEVNDPVSFSVEGVVKTVTGDIADVEVRFINGERPGESEATEKQKEKPEDNTESELLKQAEKADQEGMD